MKFEFQNNPNTEPSLEDLMYKYGTDKSKDDHKYSDLYAMLFDPIRGEVRNVMELGVATGQSLKVWHDYFSGAAIYGIDVFNGGGVEQNEKRVWNELANFNRVHLFRANSQQENSVTALGLALGSMDIVIDDADHTFAAQESTLQVMWPYVRPGGYYVIEDIEWDRDGDRKAYPFLHTPERLKLQTLDILKGNDAFFADTTLGHRDWDLWQKRTANWVIDRFSHNSHLLVIRKRIAPLRPVFMNIGVKAMKWSDETQG